MYCNGAQLISPVMRTCDFEEIFRQEKIRNIYSQILEFDSVYSSKLTIYTEMFIVFDRMLWKYFRRLNSYTDIFTDIVDVIDAAKLREQKPY